jgi:16S rRNA G966 N2-methylase RsmD
MRICKIKGCVKPDSEFYLKHRKNGKPYYSPYCKECDREKSREHKKARYHNPETRPHVLALTDIRVKNTEYREKINSKLREKYATDETYRQSILDKRMESRADPVKNPIIRKRAAKYYQKHKIDTHKRHEEKVAENPWMKLRGYMRGRISEALKAKGKSKGGITSLHYLKYTWSEFYSHIESKFEDWMSWSNYGEYSPDKRTWQVDHIIPQAYFPYESMDSENFRMCWDLRNLRPYCSQQNFKDGNRKYLLGNFESIQELFFHIRESYTTSVVREPPEDIFEKALKVSTKSDILPMSIIGLSYLDSIFTKRFDSNTIRFDSFAKAFQDDWMLFRVIVYLVNRGDLVTPTTVISNLKYVVRTPGHFFPMAAMAILNKYAIDGKVLDPFLGWGGRCLGALCSKVHSYTGYDLQPEVVDGCKKLAQDFSSINKMKINLYEGDCIKLMKQNLEMYDLIFTSPPYMDTEQYGIESDSMRQNWVDDFVFPFANECKRLLNKDGKVALHLKDLKGAPTFTAYHSAMKASGFSQINRHKYGRTWTQAVYIYSL